MRPLHQLLRGVIDADPIVLGGCVLLVVALAVAVTVRRLGRRAP